MTHLLPESADWQSEFANGNYGDLRGHNWVSPLFVKLYRIWPTDRTLTVEFADPDHEVWQMYGDGTEAACNIQPDKITLYLRPGMEENDHNIGVICHEYAHAVLAPLTEHVAEQPETLEAYRADAYVQAVENAAKRLGGLLEFAVNYAIVQSPEERELEEQAR